MHIDYESYSDLDLPNVGVGRYSRHASTEVLMAAWSLNDVPQKQWIPAEGEDLPAALEDALLDERILKWAWNAPFERSITRNVLKIDTPLESWRDTMVLALTCSLPGKLEKAGPVVDLPEDKQKSAKGRRLMSKFSSPRKPTKTNADTRVFWHQAYTDWLDYLDYNRQDEVAERAIYHKLKAYQPSQEEWDLWHLDQRINEAGIPINMRMVRNAISIYETTLRDKLDEMAEITGLANANSGPQLLPWLEENGYPFSDLKKGHVSRAIERAKEERSVGHNGGPTLDDDDASPYERVLELRAETSRTSPKKYHALRRAVDPVDGVLRYAFQFAGAARTWRWGGRLFQPQNLPRPIKKLEKGIETHALNVERLNAGCFNIIYDKPMDVLASTIRPAAQAPDGYLFIDADLNAIENRVLGWLAECEKILRVFKLKRDPYIDFATYLFHMAYDDLMAEYKGGDSSKRTIAKPGVLGCARPDTLVLTDNGWKPIVEVEITDRVFDGEQWVTHAGVVYSGQKNWSEVAGVGLTSDHKILAGQEWVKQENLNPEHWKSALNTAAGPFLSLLESEGLPGRSTAVGAPDATVYSNARSTPFSIRKDPIGRVFLVRGKPGAVFETELVEGFTIKWRDVSTRFDPGVRTRTIHNTRNTVAEELSAGSIQSILLSSTSSRTWAQTVLSKLTEKTTTNITKSGTCDWLIEVCKTAIEATVYASNIADDCTRRKNFDGSLPHATETQAQSPEKLKQGFPQKKSSSINGTVEDRIVFDIALAGPNHRYMIWSEDGPIISHNCGYMLGAGEERVNHKTGEKEATGLLGYAWNMQVTEFTAEQSKLSVDTFRREFEEVKDYWYGIERAAKKCIRTGKRVDFGRVYFDRKGPFMRMGLPSGRHLHYCRPRIEEVMMPWGEKKASITYESQNDRKQWVRESTHPGKLTENCWNSDTLVLTDSGVKRIVEVEPEDRVWDGLSWVSHGGVVDSGIQETIELGGARVTPEQRVEVDGRWNTVRSVSADAAASSFARHYGGAIRDALGQGTSRFRREGFSVADRVRLRVGNRDVFVRVHEEAAKILRVQPGELDLEGEYDARDVGASRVSCLGQESDVRSARRVEQVYDLTDCGPRSAFTVVLPDGRLILSHNCDQAIARDLLAHGMKLADRRGLDLRIHVHDQLVGLVKEDEAEEKLRILIECMEDQPDWADGLPLGSNGFISKVFCKD